MSISYLDKKEIDREKWDACIASSSNPLPYALYGYLDITCQGNFGAYIVGDYDTVFPIPRKGQSVLQPFMSQQLGAFSKKSGDDSIFFERLLQDYKQIILKTHNAPEDFSSPNFEVISRSNYLLDLSQTYENIFSGYNKSLRKRMRQQKGNLIVSDQIDSHSVIRLYKDNLEQKVKVGDKRYEQAAALFEYCEAQGMLRNYAVYDPQKELIAAALFINFKHRWINVFGASSKKGKSLAAMAVLLDAIFEQQAGSDTLFDFEGSDIPGVKKFFESFGAKYQAYSELRSDRRSWIEKLWKW